MIKDNLPFEEYLQKKEYISCSLLKEIAISPGHLKWRINNPKKQTPEMFFGNALDCLVFDGTEAFCSKYVEPPYRENDIFILAPSDYTGRRKVDKVLKDEATKSGKIVAAPKHFENGYLRAATAPYKEWLSRAARNGLAPISIDVSQKVFDCGDRLLQNPLSKKYLFEIEGIAQRSIFWKDEDTEINIKSRLDRHLTASNKIVDLKTTHNLDDFERTAFRLKYHWQAAMYLDAITQATEIYHDVFIFVVIETIPPYKITIFQAPPSIIAQGREEYLAALQLLRHCMNTDTWPIDEAEPEIKMLEFQNWMTR